MLDLLLDAVFGLLSASGPDGRGRMSTREAAGLTILPCLSFVIVLFAEIQDTTLALLVIPLAFALAYFGLFAPVGSSPGRRLAGAFGCALLCTITDFFALALVAISSLFLWGGG